MPVPRTLPGEILLVPPAWPAQPAPCRFGFPAPPRPTRRTAPNNPASSITASALLFSQLRLIAKAEIIHARQKDFKQGGCRHQQQKNRLPNQFHKRVRRDGYKLSHRFTGPF